MGMSLRLGNVQLFSRILDQTSAAMHEVMHRNTVEYAQIDDPDVDDKQSMKHTSCMFVEFGTNPTPVASGRMAGQSYCGAPGHSAAAFSAPR